uniref:Immunoglobulin V-set domain-containing protein n=1 Tax=Cyprinus carpio TaxID=7962 RepID=A0A8C1JVX0_CYPCA
MISFNYLFIFYQDFSASEDFHYIQRLEGESVDIDCVAQASKARPALLHLRRRFAPSESVLNVSEDNVLRADPEFEGRISISGQLKLLTVTLTLSHLRDSDTGLYVCDFSGDPSDPLPANTALFLLVKAQVPIYEDMSSVTGKGRSLRICPPDPETSAPGWKTTLENLYGSHNRTNVGQHQEKESS